MKLKAQKTKPNTPGAAERLYRLRYVLVTTLAVAVVVLARTYPGPGGHDSPLTPLLYVPVIAAVVVCRAEFTCALGVSISVAGLWLSQRVLPASAPEIERTAHLLIAVERGLIINAIAILGSLNTRQARRQQENLERQLRMAGDMLQSSLWMDTAGTVEEASDIALMTLRQRCSYKYAALYLRDETGERLTLQASYTGTEQNKIALPVNLPATDALLRERIIANYQESGDFEGFDFADAHALMTTTLPRLGPKPGGLIIAAFGPERKPTKADLTSLEEFAAQISLPLHRVRMQERLYGMAYTDAMTGLNNYRAFLSELENEIRRATRYPRPVSLILLDVDRFKSINDQYGHPAGDRVLQHVATLVAASIRETDVAARYGGEEFVVLCPETDQSEAAVVAERIRRALENSACLVPDLAPIQVTASLGIATYPIHADGEQALIDAADTALYEAKRSGRNRVIASTARLAA